jgi:hypothetical protein
MFVTGDGESHYAHREDRNMGNLWWGCGLPTVLIGCLSKAHTRSGVVGRGLRKRHEAATFPLINPEAPNSTKLTISTAPVTICCSSGAKPANPSAFCTNASTNSASKKLPMLPLPPKMSTPPSTTTVITGSASPVAVSERALEKRAAARLLPIAYSARPHRVLCSHDQHTRFQRQRSGDLGSMALGDAEHLHR